MWVKILGKSIPASFYFLFFLVPLIVFPETSELFEFNKMVLAYALTSLIAGLWFAKMIITKKVIFKRTPLDIPILIFLASQGVATFLSIDVRTSVLGYYSRFHGGLASSITYSFLYWAYASNMNLEFSLKAIRLVIVSTLITSIWALMEHFGHSLSCLIFPGFGTFDTSCWVQDVENRVFSTFGQPNWLAAWLAAIIPLTWALGLNSKFKKNNRSEDRQNSKIHVKIQNYYIYLVLSILFFVTLLFTKSRSGILGFIFAFIIFWCLTAWYNKNKLSFILKSFFLTTCYLLLTTILMGSPWTPNINQILNTKYEIQNTKTEGPALEVGGTESGKIRKIVWQGAIDIWKSYPVFGTGTETFAYSYYAFRPKEHNLVSEWDYLYNKAHNEYLNFAANTGTAGLIAYLILIAISLFVFITPKHEVRNPKQSQNLNLQKNKQLGILDFGNWNLFGTSNFDVKDGASAPFRILNLALLSGYGSILVTNFFGFSVVPVALLFFLYPAMAISLEQSAGHIEHRKDKEISYSQKILIFFVLCTVLYALFVISNYWYSDYLYALGSKQNDAGNYNDARTQLSELVKRSPNEPIYWDELAQATSSLAIQNADTSDMATKLAAEAYVESNTAISLSPNNVNLKRNGAARLVNLSIVDPSYLTDVRQIYEEASLLAPTDAKLSYNLSLAYLRTGDYDNAIRVMEKTIELKFDYERAHYALALMYKDVGEKEKARERLKFVLENLNSDSPDVKRELEEL